MRYNASTDLGQTVMIYNDGVEGDIQIYNMAFHFEKMKLPETTTHELWIIDLLNHAPYLDVDFDTMATKLIHTTGYSGSE